MTEAVFRADPPDARRCVVLADGVTVVYHRPSGLTHILAPPAPEVLAAMSEGDADTGTLIARLERDHDLSGTDDLRGTLTARLVELETAGLVWRP